MLDFLYGTIIGRMILKILINPHISAFAGKILDSKASRILIKPFIYKNNISLNEYEDADYQSFNEFFTRKIKRDCRPVDTDPHHFVAPCDGYLSVYPIKEGMVIPVKQSRYTIAELLKNKELSKEFEGGTCMVFRLCVHHYHRYCYPDGAFKEDNFIINGVLHTVRPVALYKVPVFAENSREYTILHTDHFGDILQMEVGAMLVGRIDNYHKKGRVEKGMEKGRFLYGGSTIIILTQKDMVKIPDRIFEKTRRQKEVPVKQGQKIGIKYKA